MMVIIEIVTTDNLTDHFTLKIVFQLKMKQIIVVRAVIIHSNGINGMYSLFLKDYG